VCLRPEEKILDSKLFKINSVLTFELIFLLNIDETRIGGACIPQPSTSQKLDSLADRLAYRNRGGTESLLVNHSVFVSGHRHSQVDGVRWYEIRTPNATPTLFQQGTFSPDSTSRWMGNADRHSAAALQVFVNTAFNPAGGPN
jgi:hypothetical protein